MVCNTAVFYDVENLIGIFHAKSGKTLQLDEIHRRILALDVVQGISVQRAYADWMLQVNRNLRSYVLQIGIEPVQIFNTNQNDKVKNAADVSLIIDAVELLARHPQIDNYVIASGDGIFAFLAKKLHEHGKRVIGCGFDRNTNIIFKNACDIFIPLENTDAALTAVVKNLNKGTILQTPPPVPEPPPAEKPAPAAPVPHPAASTPPTPPAAVTEIKIPSKLPKNKFSEVLVQSNISIWKNARDFPGSLHTMKRMVNVLFDGTPPDTDLEISVFKAYVDHYLPNFRMGQYGFKRFGEFMQFLLTASPYCLIETGGTVLRIIRRETTRKETVMDDIATLLFTLSDGRTTRSLFDIEDGVAFNFDLKAKPQEPESVKTAEPVPQESARMFIKNTFTRLSEAGKLTASEVRRLTTAEYSQATLGVKVPVFKELRSRAHLREQRTENGKVVYWKEEFKFNKKSYLIFKEWTERQHRAKFEEWLKKVDK